MNIKIKFPTHIVSMLFQRACSLFYAYGMLFVSYYPELVSGPYWIKQIFASYLAKHTGIFAAAAKFKNYLAKRPVFF